MTKTECGGVSECVQDGRRLHGHTVDYECFDIEEFTGFSSLFISESLPFSLSLFHS